MKRGSNMDKNNINNAPASAMPVDAGRWVAVDQNNLGFSVPPLPNGQPVQGPDGALYCVGKSQDTVAPVAGNANNAIPTPSGIVQLPPIVQPIALVPYTSQNQPLLQYDPYSRPVEPEAAPKAPVYIRKPYKGISIASMLIAIIGVVALLLLSVLDFAKLGARPECTMAGYQIVAGALSIFGIEGLIYGDYILANVASDNSMSKIVLSILPFVILVIAVLFVILAIKYLAKLAQGKNPRCVSALAIINIILSVLAAVLGMLAFNAEGGEAIADYFLANEGATITMGIAIIVSLVASLILFILPLCAKKNAYMVEKDPSKESYSIK